MRAGRMGLFAFCPTHLDPGAVHHSLIEGLSGLSAQLEAIPAEQEEAGVRFSLLSGAFAWTDRPASGSS